MTFEYSSNYYAHLPANEELTPKKTRSNTVVLHSTLFMILSTEMINLHKIFQELEKENAKSTVLDVS